VGGLGGTFSGNPIACAAALASLDQMAEPGFLEHSRALGLRLVERLRDMASRHDIIGDIRGLGPMLGVELVTDRQSREPNAAACGRVVELARERGLMLMGAGIYSNVVRILVPLVVTDADLEAGLDILDGAFAEV
jgi:4-aminobutyrate aminotransferase-like enzyme